MKKNNWIYIGWFVLLINMFLISFVDNLSLIGIMFMTSLFISFTTAILIRITE
jgi:hypothetical protein